MALAVGEMYPFRDVRASHAGITVSRPRLKDEDVVFVEVWAVALEVSKFMMDFDSGKPVGPFAFDLLPANLRTFPEVPTPETVFDPATERELATC